ncbi:MAG: ferrochelatase [Acidimicrobiia bacterium]|nr:ferrochelatase [Acidimicrobiia bacterium]
MTEGVLVMAYGTPGGPEDVEAYYTHIRRGRPPTPELLADLGRRYEAIGGISPLARRTEAQRAGIEAALHDRAPGRFAVVLGQKHAPPFIEDAVADLARAGVRRAVGLVLAPHYSRLSVGEYHERARTAGDAAGVELVPIDDWHLEPAYLAFLERAVATGLSRLPARSRVLFTAHSLPERILDEGDPYPVQMRETAEAVAGRLDLREGSQWSLAWQSAAPTPEPWLGPDVREVLRDLAGMVEGVLVCPAGFVADHLEVLYDLDIDARAVAEGAGLAFARTPSVNDDPGVLEALAERLLTTIGPG